MRKLLPVLREWRRSPAFRGTLLLNEMPWSLREPTVAWLWPGVCLFLEAEIPEGRWLGVFGRRDAPSLLVEAKLASPQSLEERGGAISESGVRVVGRVEQRQRGQESSPSFPEDQTRAYGSGELARLSAAPPEVSAIGLPVGATWGEVDEGLTRNYAIPEGTCQDLVEDDPERIPRYSEARLRSARRSEARSLPEFSDTMPLSIVFPLPLGPESLPPGRPVKAQGWRVGLWVGAAFVGVALSLIHFAPASEPSAGTGQDLVRGQANVAPAQVRVSISVRPEQSRVLLDDLPLSSFRLVRPADDRIHTLRVMSPGHRTVQLPIRFEHDVAVTVELALMTPAEAALADAP